MTWSILSCILPPFFFYYTDIPVSGEVEFTIPSISIVAGGVDQVCVIVTGNVSSVPNGQLIVFFSAEPGDN